MFDLEKAISEWRRQMLAAGVKAPVPLEELESHLRDDVECEIRSGASDAVAFETSVLKIGQPAKLKQEFARARTFVSFSSSARPTRVNRVLAVLWMAHFIWFSYGNFLLLNNSIKSMCIDSLMRAFFAFLYLLGIYESVLLFFSIEQGRRSIWMFSFLIAIACVGQIFAHRAIHLVLLLALATIWLLRSRLKAAPITRAS